MMRNKYQIDEYGKNASSNFQITDSESHLGPTRMTSQFMFKNNENYEFGGIHPSMSVEKKQASTQQTEIVPTHEQFQSEMPDQAHFGLGYSNQMI